MTTPARFEAAFPYQKDVLALPVEDLDAASTWYAEHFEMVEVERREEPVRSYDSGGLRVLGGFLRSRELLLSSAFGLAFFRFR